MVLEPDCELESFGPECLGQARVVENGPHMFEEPVVKRFHNSIVLWGVVCGEMAFGAFLLQELSELVAGVLTAMVRAKGLDLGVGM